MNAPKLIRLFTTPLYVAPFFTPAGGVSSSRLLRRLLPPPRVACLPRMGRPFASICTVPVAPASSSSDVRRLKLPPPAAASDDFIDRPTLPDARSTFITRTVTSCPAVTTSDTFSTNPSCSADIPNAYQSPPLAYRH